MTKHKPRWQYDCKRCKYSWCCGPGLGCLLFTYSRSTGLVPFPDPPNMSYGKRVLARLNNKNEKERGMFTEDGKIISWRHLRNEFGAVTACVRYEKDSPTIDVGFSFCSPEEKNFRKYSGRKRSLKRLLKAPIRLNRIGRGIVEALIKYLKDVMVAPRKYLTDPYNALRIAPYGQDGAKFGGRKDSNFEMWFTKFAAALEILPKKNEEVK